MVVRMRIFILEDDPNRMAKFRRELAGHQIDHAETVDAGAIMVNANKYDLLFLDHDLGGEQMVDSCDENTGYQLAKIIAKSSKNKTTPCVVHSCNAPGAINIEDILGHALLVPFPCMNIKSAAKWAQQIKGEDRLY